MLDEFHQKCQQTLLDLELNSGCIGQSCTLLLFFAMCFPLRIIHCGAYFQRLAHCCVDHILMKKTWMRLMNYSSAFAPVSKKIWVVNVLQVFIIMHGHLRECILDFGPLHSFWCFSFERYNGIVEGMLKSWHAPELQLVHKFNNLQTLAGVVVPENTPTELVHCF